MESLKSNVYLKFNENQLEEVRKSYNYDVSRLVQDINLFEDWIAKQNHFRVRKFDREYLERFLIYNKGSIERAKKHFDNLCTYRNLMPEFLQNFDLKEFDNMRSCCKIVFMPNPTPDNYRVAIGVLHGYHDKMDITIFYKYIVMCIEYILHHDYSHGYVAILDTREMSYAMLPKLNPIVIGKALSLINETMGQRMKGFHFLSGSKVIDTVVSLFKQGMSQKLASRVQVHESLESLHKIVDKDYLPADFDGNGKTAQELDDDFYKVVSSDEHMARMKFLESATTDESCRLSPNASDGTAGSFKTMTID